MIKKQHIVVGLSGGVDSAVSAYLLKKQGHKVTGIYMQNWETDNDDPYCTAQQDLADAASVCKTLNIDFHVVNFAKEYWNNVFQYCLDEFAANRTPNPDIWCNKEIKFKVFLEHAQHLGADLLATGHYAKIIENNGFYEMHKAADANKEQTYFLYTLGQKQLKHACFPLADLPKDQVRKIAQEAGLENANKKDSTGICFIGERRFKQFLKEFILGKPGDILTDKGDTVGQHDGLMYYTLGQRKGINIGGIKHAKEAAWYVIDKDVPKNQLIIGQGHDHPRLQSTSLVCNNAHWTGTAPTLPLHCKAKTRYRQADQTCTLHAQDNGNILVTFEQAQRAITPGQAVVFYQGTQCLGGATIVSRGLPRRGCEE